MLEANAGYSRDIQQAKKKKKRETGRGRDGADEKKSQYTASIIDRCKIARGPIRESDCGALRLPPMSSRGVCARACLPSRRLGARRRAHQRRSGTRRTWASSEIAPRVQHPSGSVSPSVRQARRARRWVAYSGSSGRCVDTNSPRESERHIVKV